MLLIVSQNKEQAENLSDMLNFMGILSHSATPEEAFFEIPEIYRGILILSKGNSNDSTELYTLLDASFDTVPVFILGCTENFQKSDFYLDEKLSAAEILEAVMATCNKYMLPPPGEYKNEFIDVSVRCGKARVKDVEIPLTKTEIMIMRVLLRFSRKPVKPSEILKYAFRKKRSPDEASIRTHVSKINKKGMKMLGRNLILNFEKTGYVLFEEELSEL